MGAAEVGTVEIGVAEVGRPKLDGAEVGDREPGAAEVPELELGAAKIGLPEVGWPELQAVKIRRTIRTRGKSWSLLIDLVIWLHLKMCYGILR